MTKKGIDISVWNGDIDWKKVKNQIDFAILKIGYGKEQYQRDNNFETNYKECTKKKIPVGGYWYSYATNKDEAIREANTCLSIIDGKYFAYPIWYRIEECNKGAVTVSTIADTFCSILQENGFKVGICSSKTILQTYLTEPVKKKYDIWVINTGENGEELSETNYKGHVMWQYSQRGLIDGIENNVNLDYCYKDYLIPTIKDDDVFPDFNPPQQKKINKIGIGEMKVMENEELSQQETELEGEASSPSDDAGGTQVNEISEPAAEEPAAEEPAAEEAPAEEAEPESKPEPEHQPEPTGGTANGGAIGGSLSVDTSKASEGGAAINVYYSSYIGVWFNETKNCNDISESGYSGVKGHPISCFMAYTDKGELRYRVHQKNGRWLGWSIGSAGIKGHVIDAIQIKFSGVEGYQVKYRVSTPKTDFGPWITGADTVSTYAGTFGKPIDRIQLKIEKID